jgi:hypothetical protein
MPINTNSVKELNLLSDQAFHFEILELPRFSYFAQTFEIPGISMGRAMYPTPLLDIPEPGEKVTFNDFDISFIVDEKLENYKELWKWMIHLGSPRNSNEYKRLVLGDTVYKRKSDISLNILTNKFNVDQTIVFQGAFPFALSGIRFNAANTELEHPMATASFAYEVYYFKDTVTF